MRDMDTLQRGFNRGTPPVQTAPVVRDWMTISTNTTLLLSTADVHKIVLGANVTLTLDVSNVPDRTKVRVYLTQDGTGSRTVTWAGVTWLSGTAPTLTSSAAALDVMEFTFITQASPTWIGRSLGKNVNAPSATFATLHVTGASTLDAGATIATGGLTVTAGGLTVSAGASSFQAATFNGGVSFLAGSVISSAASGHATGGDGPYFLVARADGTRFAGFQLGASNEMLFTLFNGSAWANRMSISQTGQINMPNLPTSASGLSAGDLWNSSGVVHIV